MRILLLAVLLLSGCANVLEHPFSLENIQPNCGRAYDIRTSSHLLVRLFQIPHRLVAWRDEKGELQVRPEEGSPSSALEAMGSVAGGTSRLLTLTPKQNQFPTVCQ